MQTSSRKRKDTKPTTPLDFYIQVGGLMLATLSLVALPDWIIYGASSAWNSIPLVPRIEAARPERAEPQQPAAEPSRTTIDDPKVAAVLDTIAWAEGTAGADGYRTQFTGTTFTSFADHPRQIRCSGSLCSDATGRYQFLSTTWSELKQRLGLPDFSPASQDKAAVELLRENGALEPAKQGRLSEALHRVRRVWASLPGAGYGQPEKPIDELERVFKESLERQQQQQQQD